MKAVRFLLVVICALALLNGPALAARPAQTDSPETLTAFQRLTADSGWVLMGSRLYWTDNRGQAWRELALPDLGASVILAATFVDAQQGWLVSHDLNEAGEPRYTLARTADGAQTWRTSALHLFEPGDVSALASAAYVQFLDARTGWLLVKRQTSSAFSVGTLFKTNDRGETWTRLPQAPIAGEFHFADERNGWVEDQGVRYFTRDGGQTWSSPADPKNNAATPSAPAPASGWNKSVSGECDEQGCWQTTRLMQTDDGGQTWSAIPLPDAPEGLTTFVSINSVVSQDPNALRLTFDGQGFDSCTKPLTADMQNWYTNSPYKVWNLYLGGVSLFGPCTGLTATYVSALAQQGWLFIPTWVGPQANCSSYEHRMNGDPAISYIEGKIQADLALDAATQLGLTFPDQSGSIIYYDIEVYSGASQACRDVTKAFIDGWVEQLHAYGNDAGVYGSPCSSYLSDFATFVSPPDDVWMAAWIVPPQYRSSVSLLGISCVSDDSWAAAQRLRQYAGDHTETWGGFALNIDSDVLNGTVATVLGNCIPDANQVALFVYAQNGGQCVVKGIGSYPDATAIGLPNDSISSVRVGSNVTLSLRQHTNFNGACEDITADDQDLGDNVISNDQVSSAIVTTTYATCPRLYLPVTMFNYSNIFLVNNGNFESGRTVWVESSVMTQTLIVTADVMPLGITPYSGVWSAWLGNVNDEVASLQQSVTVPDEAPYLSYWRNIRSDETGCIYDLASVLINDSPVDTYGLCTENDTGGWTQHTLDLSAYVGQTVSLKFFALLDSSVTSHLFIDDVGFQAGP